MSEQPEQPEQAETPPAFTERFRVPHTLVLLASMIVLAYFAGLLLPSGQFERVDNEAGREQVVAGTYESVADKEYSPAWTLLTAVPRGFSAAQGIIFFVFIVGGAFGVFRATGAVDAGIGSILKHLSGYPMLLVAAGMVVFAVGSATLGMAEEYIPFVPVLVALAVGLGYDRVVGVAILCLGYGVGYGTAMINPFTVLVAQEVAEVPPASGIPYRLVLLVVFFLVAFHHVWSYARKVKKDPSRSLVAGIDADGLAEAPAEPPVLTGRHLAAIAVTLGVLGVLVWGLVAHHWYLEEMGAAFLGLAAVLALVGGLGLDRAAKAFSKGAAELTTTALLIGFARAIEVVLDDAVVIDTIIHAIAQPLQAAGTEIAAVGMFAVQSLANLFIPSGSGQAYVTMPVMAPLADLVGASRQVAVLAYQFGDGFTNILVPTNAVLVGILAIAGVPYEKWVRFVLPFMVKVWILGSIALVVAVWIGF